MKIVINARFLTQQITGVQRFAIEVSRQFKKLAPDIKFVAPRSVLHEEMAKELSVTIYGKLRGHTWEQIELPVYLKNNGNPLLINLTNTAPLSYEKQVVTIHDLAFLRNPSWFSKKFYYYYKFLIPKIAKNSLKVITVSEFSKREIMDLLNISEDNIRVIYNAVSKEFMDTGKMDFPDKCGNYILAVSSLDHRKNFRNLILAFNGIRPGDIKLVIVGSENRVFANEEIKKLINSSKNIVFTGYVPDKVLAGFYKNAMCFVYPSLYEGFGLPPLEAMACGCPVVVSNIESLKEVCGDAVHYVDPYDVKSIADGIYRVITDSELRKALIEKGLQRARMFSWEKSAKEHIKVFAEVLSR